MAARTRRVGITGASGYIGTALVEALRADGAEVVTLRRGGGEGGGAWWDPERGEADLPALEGLDGFVHLAGENIAGLWTPAKKRRILESRARGTATIARALARLERPPRTFVSASAVGYYGDAGETLLTEIRPPGDDFMARVCVEWEGATAPARGAGIRTVNSRFGLVLGPGGGALGPMLIPFRLGLGGRMGSGRQWMSWISLTDAVRAIRFSLEDASLHGPINACAPEPVRNVVFTRALASALGRPAPMVVPATVLRTFTLGMGEALLLVSQRAVPTALSSAGFVFQHPTLESALHHALDEGPRNRQTHG